MRNLEELNNILNKNHCSVSYIAITFPNKYILINLSTYKISKGSICISEASGNNSAG